VLAELREFHYRLVQEHLEKDLKSHHVLDEMLRQAKASAGREVKDTAGPARAEQAPPGGSARAEGAKARESGRPPRAKTEGSERAEEASEHKR
jgi:hypothetical protein